MDPEDLLKDSTDVKAVEDGIKSMMWEHDFQQTPNETGLKGYFFPPHFIGFMSLKSFSYFLQLFSLLHFMVKKLTTHQKQFLKLG